MKLFSLLFFMTFFLFLNPIITQHPDPKRVRNVIAYLASNYEEVLVDFKRSLVSLNKFFPDNSTVPLVIFYTGNNSDMEEIETVVNTTTTRAYEMVDVSPFWAKFPSGWNSKSTPFMPKGKTTYGYHQMIRSLSLYCS